MAIESESGISVDEAAGTVSIQSLRIEDEDVAGYLADEEVDTEDLLIRALRLGVSTIDLVETTKEMEYVERRFGEMEREVRDDIEELQEELDERFGDDGELSNILDDHFGEDGNLADQFDDVFGEQGEFDSRIEDKFGENGELLQDALSPDTPGTPFYKISQQITELREKIEGEEAKEELKERTTLKGYDFEEQVESILDDLAYQAPFNVEDTSEETGELTSSKKGDFVVTLGETGQRIVVEAKNGKFKDTVDDEMTTAIENRDADYGILVASSIDYLPRTKTGWFSETDQQYAVVALSDDPDQEIETRFLKFAFHWARTRTMLSAVEVGNETDTEMIQSELAGVKESIDDFANVRTQCTNIQDSIESIRSSLTEIEEDVMSRVTRIENELGVEG